MANLEELVVQLTAETAGLRAEMNSAVKITESSMQKMEKSLEDFTKTSSKNTSFFTQSMAAMTGFLASNVVTGAFNMLKSAVAELGTHLKEGAEDAMKEEEALLRLANSMALTGQYSEAAMQDLKEFSGAMEEQTGIGDDVIASNLAMLSSLTQLSGEGLKKAQQAAVDFSAAMGVDLETATRMVGKALNGNTDAFGRYGITLTETQDKTKALELVTGELGARFGGAAAGQMATFAGSLKGAQNSINNFFEELSRGVVDNEVFKNVLKEVAFVFKELEAAAKANGPAIKEILGQALIYTIEAAKMLTDVFQVLYSGMVALTLPLRAVADGIEYVSEKLGLIEESDHANHMAEGWEHLTKITDSNNNAFDKTEEILNRLKTAGEEGFGAINETASAVEPTVKVGTTGIVKMTDAQKAHNESVKEWVKNLGEAATKMDSTYKFQEDLLKNNAEIQKTQSDNALLVEQEYLNAKLEMQQMYFEQERAQLEAARAQGLVSETEYNAAVLGLNQQQTLATVQLKKDQIANEKELDKQRSENLKSTLGTISSLQSANSKELQAIGKAAAIAQATMDGYAAVQKAWSQGGAFGAVLAAAVGAATAANVAKIAGVGLKSGIDSVPGVGNQDNFPAVLAPGERVVPAKTNEDLTEFLKEGAGKGQNITVNVNFNAPVWSKEQAGSDIVEAINEAIARGTTTGLIKT